jgi:hypothetical protein
MEASSDNNESGDGANGEEEEDERVGADLTDRL